MPRRRAPTAPPPPPTDQELVHRVKPLTGAVPMIILEAQSTVSRGGAPNAIPCGSYSAPDDSSRWYLVQTRGRDEYVALLDLHRRGFKAWVPLLVHRSRPKLAGEPLRESVVPMFPRYLFVRFDVQADRWRDIFGAEGVVRLFTGMSERPIPLPRGVVEKLQRKGRAGDGAYDDQATPFDPVSEGEKVLIVDGPMVGFEAICEMVEAERVRVLFELFGRTSVHYLRRDQVQPLEKPAA